MRILSLALFLSIIAIHSNVIAQDITDNLLIHYSFDGTYLDESGNDYTGIPGGGLTFVADRGGNPSSALQFNGIDGFVDLPNSAALKPSLPVSIAMWVKFDDLDPDKTVMVTTDFASSEHSGVWINGSSSGFLAVNVGDATGNITSANRRTKLGTTELETGVWYHIVAVVRGINDMDLYIDCRNDGGSYNGSGGSIGYTAAPGSIGRKDASFAGPETYFDGVIDEFYYWDRAISIDEVELLCGAQPSHLDEGITAQESNPWDEISVYTSELAQEIRIHVPQEITAYHVHLFDLSGQLIRSGNNVNQLTTSTLSRGIYLVNIANNENSKTVKVMVY